MRPSELRLLLVYCRTCHVWQGLLGRRRGRRGAAVQDGGAGRDDGHYVLAVRCTRLEPSLTLGWTPRHALKHPPTRGTGVLSRSRSCRRRSSHRRRMIKEAIPTMAILTMQGDQGGYTYYGYTYYGYTYYGYTYYAG